jgi:hypothetical protein
MSPTRAAFLCPGCSEGVHLLDSVVRRRSNLNYVTVQYSAFRIILILPLVP